MGCNTLGSRIVSLHYQIVVAEILGTGICGERSQGPPRQRRQTLRTACQEATLWDWHAYIEILQHLPFRRADDGPGRPIGKHFALGEQRFPVVVADQWK